MWKLGLMLLVAGCGGPPTAPSSAPGSAPAPRSAVEPAATDATAVTRPQPEPVGHLRLEGLVIDASQSPVSGARVTISTVPPRSAVSEQDGSFWFDRLVARTYRVSAVVHSHAAEAVEVSLTATSDPVVLQVRTMGTAPGKPGTYGDACARHSDCPSDAICSNGTCVQGPE